MDRRAWLGSAALAACLLGAARDAGAQGVALPLDNMDNIIGAGVGLAPDYLGSSHYEVVGGVSGRLSLGGARYVELFATELSLNVVDHPYWRFGPALNYRIGRHDVEDVTVSRMKEIDDTIEMGGFVGLEFINQLNPRYRIRVNMEVLFDVGNEHNSYVATLGARYWMPLGQALDFGMGSSISYAGGGYTNHYFGVSTADSARSGLPFYAARSGLRDFQLSPVLMFHVTTQWHVGGVLQYRRLLDAAANSPVVDQRGSADQFIGVLAVAYSW